MTIQIATMAVCPTRKSGRAEKAGESFGLEGKPIAAKERVQMHVGRVEAKVMSGRQGCWIRRWVASLRG